MVLHLTVYRNLLAALLPMLLMPLTCYMMELRLQMVCIPSSPRSAGRLPVDGRVSLQWHVQRLHAWMSASTLLRQDRSRCQHCDCDTTCVTGTGGEKLSLGTRMEVGTGGMWNACIHSSVAPQLYHAHHHRDHALHITAMATWSVKHRTTTTQAQSCSG